MGSWILRILLFLICGISGYYLIQGISPSPPIPLLGFIGGLLLAALTLLVEKGLKKIPSKNLLGSFIGLILGIMVANLLSNVFFSNLYNHQETVPPLLGLLYGICGYMGKTGSVGVRAAMRKAHCSATARVAATLPKTNFPKAVANSSESHSGVAVRTSPLSSVNEAVSPSVPMERKRSFWTSSLN